MVLAAVTVALAVLVRRDLLENGGQVLLVIGPVRVVGVIVARRQPRNAMGWLLAGVGVLALLSNDGSLYALLDYRLGHRLPLGLVAVLLQRELGTRLHAAAGGRSCCSRTGGCPRPAGGGCCGCIWRSAPLTWPCLSVVEVGAIAGHRSSSIPTADWPRSTSERGSARRPCGT